MVRAANEFCANCNTPVSTGRWIHGQVLCFQCASLGTIRVCQFCLKIYDISVNGVSEYSACGTCRIILLGVATAIFQDEFGYPPSIFSDPFYLSIEDRKRQDLYDIAESDVLPDLWKAYTEDPRYW